MATTGGHVSGAFTTSRSDSWWVGPLATLAGLGFWLIYYFWAAWQGEYYAAGPYISPFYFPLMWVDPTAPGAAALDHAFLGEFPTWWPSFVPMSVALAFGFLPGMFRITCYYYRKAYYRAFFGNPPGCAVGPVSYGSYQGETFLLIWQNLHRYTMYIAVLLLPLLYLESFRSFFNHGDLGIGLGSVMVTLNAVLLSCYTFGCHAWRHLVGGRLNCFSCDGGAGAQHTVWSLSSWFNTRHMQFAWLSLYWILLTDAYIRLVSMGAMPDINTWHGITWAGSF